ncbi:MAG: prepilin-type N-terminal cleavage/methylation domain-containing protein [Deltaproteobacteria bacterium]|nr:prepilin-type N-terminal cleavage/methylation domain-containing protein [Deltaproteobacteria bacterium]
MNFRGFTLIEVMISLVVIGMIAITVSAATSTTSKTTDIVGTSQDNYHQVQVAFDFLSRDLSSVFLSYHRAPVEVAHDTVFIGTDDGTSDSIDFDAFSHTRRFFDSKESDQAEISYYVERDKDDYDVLNLMRRESGVLDDDAIHGGQHMILVKNISGFDVQYFNVSNKEWQDEWSTTQASGEGSILPMQVRVRLTVKERIGPGHLNTRDDVYKEVSYGTQIPIPMRTPILLPWWVPGPPLEVN